MFGLSLIIRSGTVDSKIGLLRCCISVFTTYVYICWMALYCCDLAMDTIWTIVIILVILWLVGFFALPGVGALIDILLVIAVIIVIYRLATGRNVATGK